MKKANLFQKNKEGTKELVNERVFRTTERSRTNLLEETILIDE